jgi:GntR family transcriptional regulator
MDTPPARPGRPLNSRQDDQSHVHRIHSILRSGIRTGRFAPGQVLDEAKLGVAFQTSRNATREALRLLARSGMVVREVARGTYVVGHILTAPVDHLWSPAFDKQMNASDLTYVEIDRRFVRTSGLFDVTESAVGEDAYLVDHLVRFGGRPVALRSVYLPTEPDPLAIADRISFLPQSYEDCFGVRLLRQECTVEAIPCDARTSRLLEIAENDPVLLREIVLRDTDGAPRVRAFQINRSDRVAFSNERYEVDG